MIGLLMINHVKTEACGTLNPLWTSFEEYVNENTELPDDIKAAILEYETYEPATMTEDNLGVCADAVGYTDSTTTTTCCTADWLQNVQILLRNHIGKLTEKRPPIFKAIEKLE